MADFGNSYLRGSDCHTKPRGVIPYMDPMIFKNHSYILTKKSDVYSLGVLLWELTSCSSPFNFETKNDPDKITVMLGILNGKREKPIPNTNGKFVTLYESKYKF